MAGIVAVILALAVAVSIIIISIGAEITNQPLSSEEQTLISTVVGAALGAVATYIGIARTSNGNGSPPSDKQEPPAPT
jgi:uncharacterized membrane protein